MFPNKDGNNSAFDNMEQFLDEYDKEDNAVKKKRTIFLSK